MAHPGDAPLRPGPTVVGLSLLVALLLGLIELGVLDYAYERIGVDHRWFGGLLFLSLMGSLVNVPLGSLPRSAPTGDEESADLAAGQPSSGRTILAVNVGGALVPTGLSIWVLSSRGSPASGWLAVAVVAVVTHLLAKPVRGLGIAVPILIPPLAAAAAALVLAPERAAGVAYAAGSLGTLIGADLSNLGKIRSLGAPLVSIGGAGTFDGVFLSGIIAVLLA